MDSRTTLCLAECIYFMDSRTTLRLAGWFWRPEPPLSGLGQHCGELIANED